MDDTPFYKRPWFYIAGWLFFLLVIYGWQIYRIGNIQDDLINIFIDLACLFPIILILWVAFFAQFVLPVRTVADRQKIVDRLFTYLSGGHGPALFIENGKVREHQGERLKKGPGVVWLDSASGAVTRTATRIKQTMGPGVYFMDNGEFFAGTVDLHIQSQGLGPKETDKPFEEAGDDPHMQERRKQVSAWTRDGIEVVPNISVSFRIDTGFPKEGKPGSRFGFRTGITKKDRENEQKDKEAIQKAILGEGINPNMSTDSPRHRVAWNQLPVQLAVDVWREYVAKFTLDELFKPTQPVPPPTPPAPEVVEEEIDPLTQALSPTPSRIQDGFTAMLREINKLMDRTIKWLEGTPKAEPPKPAPMVAAPPAAPSLVKTEPELKTAMQVINEMVKARLTQAEVDFMDEHGIRGTQPISSPEYKLLQSRGLKVNSVGISNIRFHPKIEDTIIKSWSASWLKTAENEKKQIDRRRNILETSGQEQAIRNYAEKLSADLMRRKPSGVPETLKTLVMRTRAIIIENEKLRQDLTEEQDTFEEIIKWMELNGK